MGFRPAPQLERDELQEVLWTFDSPPDVVEGTYTCSPPLIRPSRLTSRERGGVGKDLSGGWSLNFAVGCTHGCPFCYVDSIHKRFGVSRYGRAVMRRWGDYFLVPGNLDEVIERTPWGRWRGKEVMILAK